MGTSELASVSSVVTNLHEITAFELTQMIIRNGRKLELKPAELLVLSALSTYYNADTPSKAVYPKEETLAENTAQSVRTVQRALTELIKAGYVLKSKRHNKTNANVYVINTHKIADKLSSETRQIDTNKHDKLSHSCNRTNNYEEIKEQQHVTKTPQTKPNKVVAFNSISHKKKVTLEDVPEIIRNNKNVRNPVSYWASLDEETRTDYLKKEQQKKELAEKKKAAALEEERKKEEERKQREYERSLPPFYEREGYTKEEGLRFVATMPPQMWETGIMAKAIRERFSITIEELHQARQLRNATKQQ